MVKSVWIHPDKIRYFSKKEDSNSKDYSKMLKKKAEDKV
jgi:hypothetical protein